MAAISFFDLAGPDSLALTLPPFLAQLVRKSRNASAQQPMQAA
jgi:hypothetical protein